MESKITLNLVLKKIKKTLKMNLNKRDQQLIRKEEFQPTNVSVPKKKMDELSESTENLRVGDDESN